MFRHRISIQSRGSANFEKQSTFALASALTFTAKEIQTAEIKAVEQAFTVRTNWDKQSPLAIKVQPATKTNLLAIVGTAFEQLTKFVEEPAGAIVLKLPQGEFIAIPTANVRRTKRDLITKGNRPRFLLGKRDVVLPMKNGRGLVLFQRRGRGSSSRLVALYYLVPRAKIHEKDVLFGPAEVVFTKRFGPILEAQIEKAFATAR